jgi:hypothetical protein
MDHFATVFALHTAPALKSHRPGEPPEKYSARLTRARLKRSELAEIEALYVRLNIEREALGLAAAERAPFTPADILEWQDLKLLEKFLSLQSYAAACDRATRPSTTPREMFIMEPGPRKPHVLNKRDIKGAIPATAVYCGRPSPLGNPFVIGKDGNRAEVIAKHAAWIKSQPQLLPLIRELRGLDLVCYCAPEPCHCDILLQMANAPMRGKIHRAKTIRRCDLQTNPDRLYVFGDNMERKGRGGQAAEMRDEPNAIGIPTKWKPAQTEEAFFSDAAWNNLDVKSAIENAFRKLEAHLSSGKDVVLPADGIGTGLAQLPSRAPRLFARMEKWFGVLEARSH